VQKYPPSLAISVHHVGHLHHRAGPVRAGENNKVSQVFEVYGRVPLFYYILHIYLVHWFANCSRAFVKRVYLLQQLAQSRARRAQSVWIWVAWGLPGLAGCCNHFVFPLPLVYEI
jgi:uncharacterized membrane protein